jgi:drug/metabolite transporter (DMT)-like permease
MTKRLHRPASGPLLALVSAGLFGASTPAARALLASGAGISPWMLAGILYLGSGVGLGLLRWAGSRRAGPSLEEPLRARDWPWMAAVVALGGMAGPVLLMKGLTTVGAAPASLLLNLEAVFTAGLAWFAFREPFDRRILLGMLLIVAGGALLSWPGGSLRLGPGALAIAGACLCWALDNNLTRKLSGSDATQIAMVKGLAAGGTNLALAWAVGASLPPLPHLALGALIGFVGYGLSLVCFVLALRHIGSARTGAYFSVAPFAGMGLALAVGMEPPSLRLLAAGALMALGVWLHLTERHDHEHTHEALDHAHPHSHDEHHQHSHGGGDPEGELHTHRHQHEALTHQHPHTPDLHHLHPHP